MKSTPILLMLAAVCLLFSCHRKALPDKHPENLSGNNSVPIAAPDTSLVMGNNRFALELFQYIRSDEKNVFYSPYSISAALAMTYGGARGESEKQMSQVLHFSPDQQKFHPKFRDLLSYVAGLQQGDSLEMRTANALFVQKEFPVLTSYLDLINNYYGAGLQQVDFKNDLEKARLQINAWVAQQTQNRIKDLIVQGMINELARLVIVNTIYFNGSWEHRFDEKETMTRPFYRMPGKSSDASFMHRQGEYRYYQDDLLQAIEIPYLDSTLSMLVLLPQDHASMGTLEQSLNAGKYLSWIRQMSLTKVNLYLPRFRMTAEFELSEVLKKMGMPHPFSLQADLSGIDGKKDLLIDKVIHKAFVEVSEKGTEASAATAVVIRLKSAPVVPEFNANHPFLFFIKDNQYHSILFAGKMNEVSVE